MLGLCRVILETDKGWAVGNGSSRAVCSSAEGKRGGTGTPVLLNEGEELVTLV